MSFLNVSGNSYLNNYTTVNAPLYISMYSILNNNVSINSSLNISSNTIIYGIVSCKSLLNVSGNSILNSITNNSILNSNFNNILNIHTSIYSSLNVSSYTFFNNITTINSTLTAKDILLNGQTNTFITMLSILNTQESNNAAIQSTSTLLYGYGIFNTVEIYNTNIFNVALSNNFIFIFRFRFPTLTNLSNCNEEFFNWSNDFIDSFIFSFKLGILNCGINGQIKPLLVEPLNISNPTLWHEIVINTSVDIPTKTFTLITSMDGGLSTTTTYTTQNNITINYLIITQFKFKTNRIRLLTHISAVVFYNTSPTVITALKNREKFYQNVPELGPPISNSFIYLTCKSNNVFNDCSPNKYPFTWNSIIPTSTIIN